MKLNKLVGLGLVVVFGLGVVGCGNEVVENELSSVTIEENIIEEPKNNFDDYNILTIGELEIDNTPEYSGDTYVDLKCKVTNNSDKMLSSATVTFALYDEDGVLLETRSGGVYESIPANSSFYVDSIYDQAEINVKEIKIISYDYNIGEAWYQIDLQSKVAEVWE